MINDKEILNDIELKLEKQLGQCENRKKSKKQKWGVKLTTRLLSVRMDWGNLFIKC